jgi:ATP adenylyltransferase
LVSDKAAGEIMSNWHQPDRSDAARQAIGCPLCTPRAANNEYRLQIAPLAISTLYLFRDQRFRGYCLLVFDAWHATSLTDLSNHEYSTFMTDLQRALQAIQHALQPDHLNCESLGNSNPHLHWHIVPRYKNDPRWGQPIWEGWPRAEFTVNRVSLPEAQERMLIEQIHVTLQRSYP